MITTEIHQEVAAQRRAFGDLVRRLDPDDLPASHAPGLWCELDQLGRQVAAAKAMVARRRTHVIPRGRGPTRREARTRKAVARSAASARRGARFAWAFVSAWIT